jgi:apolipoprotein N-acyltransferase
VVFWPETAVPARLLSATALWYRNMLHGEVDKRRLAVVTGFPHMIVYEDSLLAPPSSKRIRSTGERYDDFNAAVIFQPDTKGVQWYGKMKMVPLAERIPYADAFYYLDFLRWDVGIGGWQIGIDSTIFVEETSGTRFSVMICYESTYPDFVASFVRKGAEFISVITIDSWWGHMSGAFQHSQFAVFRAIENRRWVVRCALGGISGFIDPFGRFHDKTPLFERAVLARTVPRHRELTFYTRHPDLLPLGSVVIAGLFVAAGAGRRYKEKHRKRQWNRQ